MMQMTSEERVALLDGDEHEVAKDYLEATTPMAPGERRGSE